MAMNRGHVSLDVMRHCAMITTAVNGYYEKGFWKDIYLNIKI